MRRDRAVARRVGDAGQHEALADLVVVEERLVRLVDAARDDLARARGAGARAARVGEVDAGLLRGVENVGVVWRVLKGVSKARRRGEKEEEREKEEVGVEENERCCRSRRSRSLVACVVVVVVVVEEVNQAIFQQLYPAPFGRDRALPRPRSLARRRGESPLDPYFEATGQNRSHRPRPRGIWVGSRGKKKERTRRKIFLLLLLSLSAALSSFQKRLIDALLSTRQFEYQRPFSSAHCRVTA